MRTMTTCHATYEQSYSIGKLRFTLEVDNGMTVSELVRFIREQNEEHFDGIAQMPQVIDQAKLIRAYKRGEAESYLDECRDKGIELAWREWATQNAYSGLQEVLAAYAKQCEAYDGCQCEDCQQ